MITCQSRQLPASSGIVSQSGKALSLFHYSLRNGLLGSDTGLLFPHVQMAWARIRWLLQQDFQGKKLVLCWPPCCQQLPGPVSHIPPKHHVLSRQSSTCAVTSCLSQRSSRAEHPRRAPGSSCKRRDFNGEIWGQGERAIGHILRCFWGQEDYGGNGLLLCVIVLEFLFQGSLWSTARAC